MSLPEYDRMMRLEDRVENLETQVKIQGQAIQLFNTGIEAIMKKIDKALEEVRSEKGNE